MGRDHDQVKPQPPFMVAISGRHHEGFAHRAARVLRQLADRIEDSAEFAHMLKDEDQKVIARCGFGFRKVPK